MAVDLIILERLSTTKKIDKMKNINGNDAKTMTALYPP
jgi:hypothetical protein